MSKKVVLVSPGSSQRSWASPHPPINVGYIAAYLEAHGVEVRIVDELAGQDAREAFLRLKPDIVGITATTPLVPDAYRVAGIAKELGILTVMGGKHAMILPEEALMHVDIVVLGEGEKAMLDIVNGARDRVIRVPYFKSLDEVPSPAWHLMDMEFYLTSKERTPSNHLRLFPPKSRIAALISTRGCPYSCIFCYNSWSDAPLRSHSPERVLSDVKHLMEKYGANAFFFMDDDFFVPRKWFKRICELFISEGINKKIIWGCQTTADHVSGEYLELAKRAGCYQVGFGFESGSQRILEMLKKQKTSVEDNAKAARLCRETGVKSWATFMIGNPTETMEDIQATFDFIRNNPIDGVGIHVTTPFPGTELWNWCKERNLIPEKLDWSIFDTGHITIPACDTIPPQDIERLRDEMQYYFHPISLRHVLSRKSVILEAMKHPASAMKRLKFLNVFKGVSRGGGSDRYRLKI
ncbi:MAG: radical SAM protein [Thermodesulfobacteriota bacterium]